MGLPSINPPIRVLIRTRLAQLQKIDPSFDKADTELIKRLCDRLSITGETKIRHLITRISDNKKVDDNRVDDNKVDDNKVDDKKVDGSKVDGNKADGEKVDDNKVDDNKVDDNRVDGEKVDGEKVDGEKVDGEKVDGEKVDGKKLERVDIIFDYGSPTIECQPRVMAYSITVEGSDLTIKQLSHPNIRKFVNLTVKTFESINLENNRCFPNRPDIRAETRRQRRAVLPVSKSSFNIQNLILISL
jgi:hypothetical protein